VKIATASMHPEWRRLIEAIHDAPQKCVVVVTGGGASAISDLLVVPGGSRTVLEASVPCSSAALTAWLGRRPEQFCTEETALAMAAVAYERACRLAETDSSAAPSSSRGEGSTSLPPNDTVPLLAGIACTAALVSDRPKKGDHRCHVAVQTASATASASITLQKGGRDRAGEEQLVGRLILAQLARAAGIVESPPLELMPAESISTARADADSLLVELRTGRRALVWSLPEGSWQGTLDGTSGFSPPRGVLCGAFNPLHHGHQELRRVAQERLGGVVYYELSLRNVDKPPLDYLTIDRRRMQFADHPLALTMAPTFAEKARALPGVVFVVGVDTAERILQSRYYGESADALRHALICVRDQGCRFLVAGRKLADRFQTLDDLDVPPEFAGLFEAISAESFRADVSSTELRARG
jgi:hypothetical protein